VLKKYFKKKDETMIEKKAKELGIKTRNIYEEFRPLFREEIKNFLDKKINTTVLEYFYHSDKALEREYCLCKFIGSIIDVPINKLKIEDIEFFVRFISRAVDEKIIKFGIVGMMAMKLKNDKTLLRIYTFSDFTNEQLNTIIQIGLGFDNITTMPEGAGTTEINKDISLLKYIQ
jgi:hypothetical protein